MPKKPSLFSKLRLKYEAYLEQKKAKAEKRECARLQRARKEAQEQIYLAVDCLTQADRECNFNKKLHLLERAKELALKVLKAAPDITHNCTGTEGTYQIRADEVLGIIFYNEATVHKAKFDAQMEASDQAFNEYAAVEINSPEYEQKHGVFVATSRVTDKVLKDYPPLIANTIRKALTYCPNNPTFIAFAFEAFYANREFQAGEEVLARGLELLPDDPKLVSLKHASYRLEELKFRSKPLPVRFVVAVIEYLKYGYWRGI